MNPQFASAVRCMQAGQLAEAERLCREILAATPNDAASIHLLGFGANKPGGPHEAIELIGRALARDEENRACHFTLGLALRAAGRLAEAASHVGRATALKPDYTKAVASLIDLTYNGGNQALQQGRLDEAIACYRRTGALRPGFAAAHSNLAVALMGRGQAAAGA